MLMGMKGLVNTIINGRMQITTPGAIKMKTWKTENALSWKYQLKGRAVSVKKKAQEEW